MQFKPVISLHGSGESVVLSNGAHADFTLMQGASGLGVRPQDISSVALPSGGSLVQHVRGTEAVIQLPILLGGSARSRWDLRRQLERLCRGEIEVRVTRPNGVYRSRFGHYQSGLEGEYGAGEDSPDGQKIVLEIFCPTGLWKGAEQLPEFRLAGLRKRFLSDGPEPLADGAVLHKETRAPSTSDAGNKGDVWLVGENAYDESVEAVNLNPNPSFESGTDGYTAHSSVTLNRFSTPGYQVFENYGATADIGAGAASLTWVRSPSVNVTPGKWLGVGVHMRGGTLSTWVRLRVIFYSGSGAVVGSSPYITPMTDIGTSFGRITGAALVPVNAVTAVTYFYAYNDSEGSPPVSGSRYRFDGWSVIESDTESETLSLVSDYFDGDSKGGEREGSPRYRWVGEPHSSVSEMYRPERGFTASERYKHDGSGWVNVGLEKVSPFLPVVLASSTVQGEITVDIGGDAPAYPTWIVDGPGTDLVIENDKGEHLKVLTEFSEQVTITTDPLMQDILSESNPNGELWEFVPTDSTFFALEPGQNKLKVSMVGAKPNSRVQLSYRETYLAGW